MNYGRAKEYGPHGCEVPVGNGKCGETKTLVILNEFKTLYEKRMEQLDAEIRAGGDCLQEKMSLQEQWIRDLMEQNEMMARTVEQLEIEATERVQMLEQKLQSSAKCICEVMKRYREYSSSLHLDEPFQKMFYVENDLKNLLEFIRRIREDNRWSIEGLQFYDITYKDLFGDKGCANDCPAISAKNVDHATKVGKSLKISFELVGSNINMVTDNAIPCPYSTPPQCPAIKPRPVGSCVNLRNDDVTPCPYSAHSQCPAIKPRPVGSCVNFRNDNVTPCTCSICSQCPAIKPSSCANLRKDNVIPCPYSSRSQCPAARTRPSSPCSCPYSNHSRCPAIKTRPSSPSSCCSKRK